MCMKVIVHNQELASLIFSSSTYSNMAVVAAAVKKIGARVLIAQDIKTPDKKQDIVTRMTTTYDVKNNTAFHWPKQKHPKPENA